MKKSKSQIRFENDLKERLIPNAGGKIAGSFVDENGLYFSFTLNPQREKWGYLYTGTLSLKLKLSKTRLFQETVLQGEKQRVASGKLHVRRAKEGEDQIQLILDEITRVHYDLDLKFRSPYISQIKKDSRLDDMTFLEAEQCYLPDATAKLKTQSAETRAAFERRIRHFAKELGNSKIGKVSAKKLAQALPEAKVDTRKKYLKDLLLFVKFVEKEQKLPCSLREIIESELARTDLNKNKADHRRAALTASNSNALNNTAEELLNQVIEKHLDDPVYIGVALLKGSGLKAAQLCELKCSDLIRNEKDETRVFIRLHQEFHGSATQNYTFPIFPLEAKWLNQYLTAHGVTVGKEDADRYVLSLDEDGKNPLDHDKINDTARKELALIQVGYADMIGSRNLLKEKGFQLLLNTYAYRLEQYAGIPKEKDEGAFLFMTHRALGNKVQADHYRSFTGETGRAFLMSCVQQDRRGLEERKHRKEYSERTRAAGGSEYTLWGKDPYAHNSFAFLIETGDAEAKVEILMENGGKVSAMISD